MLHPTRHRASPRSRRCIVTTLAVLGLVSCGEAEPPGASGAAAPPPDAPNVLLVVADDLGWNDVGYHGSEIRTPRIDALAAEGVRAERFYALPTCSPTRAALLTGRFPARYGFQGGAVRPWDGYGLPESESTLADDLRAAGYETALVGKWHLGMTRPEHLPSARGFEHHYGPYGGMVDYWRHRRLGALDWHRAGQPVREEGHATDLLAAEAVRILEERPLERPLFLMLSFTAPHTPLQPTAEDEDAYAETADPNRRNFSALVSQLDRAVGSVLDALAREGLADRTLVIFLSDNGASASDGGSNAPLRGGKGQLTEGGVRVPAVFTWPGRLPAGAVARAPLHAVDVRATVRALAGIAPAGPDLDGIDVFPVLRGEAQAARPIPLNVEARRAAVVFGPWKLLVRGPVASPEALGLFDVAADPGEATNLAQREPERVEQLLSHLRELEAGAAAPLARHPNMPPGFEPPDVWGPR